MDSQGEWSDSSAGLSSIEGAGEEDWGKSPRFPRSVQQGHVGEPWSQSRLQRSILRADLPHTLAGFSYCPGELSSVQCCSRDGFRAQQLGPWSVTVPVVGGLQRTTFSCVPQIPTLQGVCEDKRSVM